MADTWIKGAIKRPGAFSAKAKAAGKGTQAFARSVLKEGSKASTRTKKQAALAQTLSRLRSGNAKFVLPLLLLLPAPASAATKACPSGTLAPAPATATGPTTDIIIAKAAPALTVQATSPAGTATVVVEMSCDSTNWAPVQSSSMSLAAATPSQAVSVLNPTCTYRANVTACASCSVTILYSCSGA
jgi:hypothetical protein